MKSQTKFKIAAILAITVLLTDFGSIKLILAATPGNSSVEDLTTQKNDKNRQLLEIKAKVADLQNQINTQRKQIASLANEIQLYQLQIQQSQQQINAIQAEIDVLNIDIVETLNDVNATEGRIETKKQLLAELIRQIYEYDNKSPLELVLSHDNFSDILNQLQNTISFQNENQGLLQDLQSLKNDLAAKQDALEKKKKDLVDLKIQSEGMQTALLAQQAQKANLLSATRGKESKYKVLLTSAADEEAQVNREVYNLDLAIRNKLGDKTLPAVSGTFAWPMEGVITQGFGNTGFTKMGYSFHNGIDIAAPAGTAIRAAADGVVYATGTGTTAYGNWVVIKHNVQVKNDGLKTIYTLYAHFQSVIAKSGQGVLKGDLIGLEGNTGNTTRLLYGEDHGYHLHFSVFDEEGFGIKDGAYANIYGPYQLPYGYAYDPMDFLK